MTPEQIERIRRAAEELEAALSDTRSHVEIRHDMIDVTTYGSAQPEYVHTLHVKAVSELRTFP